MGKQSRLRKQAIIEGREESLALKKQLEKSKERTRQVSASAEMLKVLSKVMGIGSRE